MKFLGIVFLAMFIMTQFSDMTFKGVKVTNLFTKVYLGLFVALLVTIIFGLPVLGILYLLGF